MSKGMAWFHLSILALLLVATPIVSTKIGPEAGAVTGMVLFLAFCFWPINRG